MQCKFEARTTNKCKVNLYEGSNPSYSLQVRQGQVCRALFVQWVSRHHDRSQTTMVIKMPQHILLLVFSRHYGQDQSVSNEQKSVSSSRLNLQDELRQIINQNLKLYHKGTFIWS